MDARPGEPLRVRVTVLSWVNRFVGGPGTGEVTLTEDVKPGATVRTALRQLTARYPELDRALWDPASPREIGDNVEVMVNDAVLGVSHDLDTELAPSDHVTLLGQYMGGSLGGGPCPPENALAAKPRPSLFGEGIGSASARCIERCSAGGET